MYECCGKTLKSQQFYVLKLHTAQREVLLISNYVHFSFKWFAFGGHWALE